MLRTNLSTRPFYNQRLVRAVLMVATVLVAALTVFNIVKVWQLRSQDADVRRRAASDEGEAGRLQAQARQIRQSINRDQLAVVQAAAQEANQLIDRRAFSWTDLFNRFERTLPAAVRIASVTPQVDQSGRMLVAITVVSRRVEDLDAFIEALEQTRAFQDVLWRQEEAQEDGTLRSTIQGYYAEPAVAAASDTPPAEGVTAAEGRR